VDPSRRDGQILDKAGHTEANLRNADLNGDTSEMLLLFSEKIK
jgi:hypothetical protein